MLAHSVMILISGKHCCNITKYLLSFFSLSVIVDVSVEIGYVEAQKYFNLLTMTKKQYSRKTRRINRLQKLTSTTSNPKPWKN